MTYKHLPISFHRRLSETVSHHRELSNTSYSFTPIPIEHISIPPNVQISLTQSLALMMSTNPIFSNCQMENILSLLHDFPSLCSDSTFWPSRVLLRLVSALKDFETSLNSAIICHSLISSTSAQDSFWISASGLSSVIQSILIHPSPDFDLCHLCLQICVLLLRDPTWHFSLFNSEVYHTLNSLYLSSPSEIQTLIASLILSSVKKPGAIPDLYSLILNTVSLICQSTDLDIAISGFQILRHLSRESEQIVGILADGSIISNLIQLFNSTADLFFLETLVSFVTFGDQICVHITPIFETLLEWFDVRNDKMVSLICELISNWVSHESQELGAIFKFVCGLKFSDILESVGFALKEKTLHTLRLMIARFDPADVFVIVSFETFAQIVDILETADGNTEIVYDACWCLQENGIKKWKKL
jgi:hypothetical protein